MFLYFTPRQSDRWFSHINHIVPRKQGLGQNNCPFHFPALYCTAHHCTSLHCIARHWNGVTCTAPSSIVLTLYLQFLTVRPTIYQHKLYWAKESKIVRFGTALSDKALDSSAALTELYEKILRVRTILRCQTQSIGWRRKNFFSLLYTFAIFVYLEFHIHLLLLLHWQFQMHF